MFNSKINSNSKSNSNSNSKSNSNSIPNSGVPSSHCRIVLIDHIYSLYFVFSSDTPFLALTGTANEATETSIVHSLCMKNYEKVFVSPNRENLKLDWIVEMVKAYGTATPKTIVFCPTLYAVGSVINYLIMQQGRTQDFLARGAHGQWGSNNYI